MALGARFAQPFDWIHLHWRGWSAHSPLRGTQKLATVVEVLCAGPRGARRLTWSSTSKRASRCVDLTAKKIPCRQFRMKPHCLLWLQRLLPGMRYANTTQLNCIYSWSSKFKPSLDLQVATTGNHWMIGVQVARYNLSFPRTMEREKYGLECVWIPLLTQSCSPLSLSGHEVVTVPLCENWDAEGLLIIKTKRLNTV